MVYLITGGAGFIGSHLAERLLERGDEVLLMDNLSTGSMENIRHLKKYDRMHYFLEPLENRQLLAELVDEADVIFHLAAAVGVKLIVESPVRTIETNVNGTQMVLEAACRKRKLVFTASTSEVYGKNTNFPFHEDADLVLGPTTKGRWSYAASKALDEFLALAYHQERGLDCVIVRLFNTVGPRQSGQYGMVIPRFVTSALSGRPLEIHGDGTQTRCFCHVQDTIRALRDLMTDLHRTAGQIFNVGANNQSSIIGLAERIKAMVHSESPLVHVPFDEVYGTGIEDMLHRVPCTDKVRDAIGWVPEHTLEQILTNVITSVAHREAIAA